MILNIVLFVLFTLYFLHQSFYDVFNKQQVPTLPSYFMMSISFITFIYKVITTGAVHKAQLIFFGIFFGLAVLWYWHIIKSKEFGNNWIETTQKLLTYFPMMFLLSFSVGILNIWMGLTLLIIWFGCQCKIYNTGDRNALIALLFYYAFFGCDIPRANIFFLLLTYFFALFPFVIVHKAWKIKDRVERYAFFPYLTFGFIVTTILGGLSYGRI